MSCDVPDICIESIELVVIGITDDILYKGLLNRNLFFNNGDDNPGSPYVLQKSIAL